MPNNNALPPVPEDRYLSLAQGRFCLRRWHGEGPLLLCLHGWQDNAASFAPLAGCGLNLLALEFAGHGHSGHYPPGMSYALADHLMDLLDVLDALDETPQAVLGHSLGGAIASLAAAARPEAIPTLMLVEALGPMSGADHDAVDRLRRAAEARRQSQRPRPRQPVDLANAVAARRRAGPDDALAARLLVERNLLATPEGFRWRSDPRIRLPSPWRLAESTIQSLVRSIEQPVLLLCGSESQLPVYARERAEKLPRQADVRMLPGDHHLHMSHPQAVAEEIRRFLTKLG